LLCASLINSSMDIEFATDLLCNRFLTSLNSSETEVVLEIGLGSLNYSFQWAAPLGFRCLAVEPLPTESLLVATKHNRIELVVAAMGAQSGEVPIYHGVLHDHDLPDISSLNPRWWGVSERSSIVPCLTLPELCTSRSIERIALLKVDTEGSEYDVISLLPELRANTKPRVITVEYGGGGNTRSSQIGGWAPEFLTGIRQLLEITKKEGYSATIVFESNRLIPKLRIGAQAFNVDELFDADFLVGNLMIVRDLEDAKIFPRLISSSIYRLIYSECQGLLKKQLNHQKYIYIRLKSKIKSILSTSVATSDFNR
jgi:FkbM family methyltransferase